MMLILLSAVRGMDCAARPPQNWSWVYLHNSRYEHGFSSNSVIAWQNARIRRVCSLDCLKSTSHEEKRRACQPIIVMGCWNQEFLDRFLQYSIIASAVVALGIGYCTWSLKSVVIVYAIGVCFAMLVVVPDWLYFTKRPLWEWFAPMAADKSSKVLQQARFPILKKTAKYAERDDMQPWGTLFFLASLSCSTYFTWRFIISWYYRLQIASTCRSSFRMWIVLWCLERNDKEIHRYSLAWHFSTKCGWTLEVKLPKLKWIVCWL